MSRKAVTMPLPLTDLATDDHKDGTAEIGRELAELREAAGLTQKEAAQLLGVASENTISRWETGDRAPRGELYRRAVSLYRMRASERHATYNAVPRGTSGQAARIAGFEREMVRLGADDFEADHVRERARAFVEAIHSQGGTDVDEELELYLESSLKPWVVAHMKRRGAKPKEVK